MNQRPTTCLNDHGQATSLGLNVFIHKMVKKPVLHRVGMKTELIRKCMCDNEMTGMLGKHSTDRNMALNSNIPTVSYFEHSCIMELHSLSCSIKVQ